jgi:catechol 2,3-dioxygenase-like lactoylglutathione lyase family enzyme
MQARFDLIGLIVADLDATISFYSRLGIEFPDPPDPEGHGHVEATLPGGLRFALDTAESVKEFDPEWKPASGGHQIALAFLCDSPAGVDAVYKELTDQGVKSYKEPWDAFWGQRYAQVKDPDGNIVDLFAPL